MSSIKRYLKKNTRLGLAQKSLKKWRDIRSKTLRDSRFIEIDKVCENCFKILNVKIHLIEDKTFSSVSCPVCHRGKQLRDEDVYSNHNVKWMKKWEAELKSGKRQRSSGTKMRLLIIERLSGTKCKRCGFDDVRALQLDHIKGDGMKDRKRFKNDQYMWFYYYDHPEQARKKLQVLCANCNWIKRYENDESSWHTKRKDIVSKRLENIKKFKSGLKQYQKKSKS